MILFPFLFGCDAMDVDDVLAGFLLIAGIVLALFALDAVSLPHYGVRGSLVVGHTFAGVVAAVAIAAAVFVLLAVAWAVYLLGALVVFGVLGLLFLGRVPGLLSLLLGVLAGFLIYDVLHKR